MSNAEPMLDTASAQAPTFVIRPGSATGRHNIIRVERQGLTGEAVEVIVGPDYTLSMVTMEIAQSEAREEQLQKQILAEQESRKMMELMRALVIEANTVGSST